VGNSNQDVHFTYDSVEKNMRQENTVSAFLLGASIFLGLSVLGYLLASAAIHFKEYERSVTVKGLSEQELPADIVIWPIVFTEAGNELGGLYASIEASTTKIKDFLIAKGIDASEITASTPSITDKLAQQYNNTTKAEFRYTAAQTVTVYSSKVDLVRKVMTELAELGKQGIAFTGGDYQNQNEYIFTGLNKIKPEMIQEATNKAREVALKFAQDSNSKLGKIKQASQGQFEINPRDKNNPHIKKIRVVSTVEYYLSD
jgi:hypothetical protein